METQPQLLLLQKTMLVAEGVGRKLAPDANFWLMAQPLIENWVTNNLSPETLISETVGEVTKNVRKIPRMLSDLEKNTAEIARGGLKLHPDTIRSMGYSTKRHWYRSPGFYIIVITILMISIFLIQ